ncbi:hypothetical protein EPN15_00440 [Patescibacteria group bacterium]|nr:MAG: hypothetical protein EPN15_00440 [Patescibacteria group bacterium]
MKNIKRFFAYSFVIPAFLLGIFLFAPGISLAAEYKISSVKIIDDGGQKIRQFKSLDTDELDGASIATGDLGGDGVEEIVVGANPGGEPSIQLFRQDGSLIRSFSAYGKNFRGGVNVAVGDVNGDGIDEIVTAPSTGGTPQIRIFDGFGKVIFTLGFLAYSENFRGGVNVAAGDVNGDGIDEIITAPVKSGGPQVRIFNRYGEETGFFWAYENDFKGGVSIYSAEVDGVSGDEIITGRQSDGNSEIKIFTRGRDLIKKFHAYSKNFKGGVNVSAADLDGNGISEIVTAPASGGGPQVRIFSSSGNLVYSNFIYNKNFRGEVNLSAIDTVPADSGEEILTVLSSQPEAKGGEKRIDVDISDQVLKFYEGEKKIGEHRISTGKWSMPTPIGTFQIRNHVATAYSRRYALYMDWWMAITPDGAYGIHSLPYWKTKNGVIYEGRDHIGKRVSHGCVRQLPEQSKILYDWALNGTKVVVHE